MPFDSLFPSDLSYAPPLPDKLPPQVLTHIVELTPHLCDRLESIHNALETAAEKMDESADVELAGFTADIADAATLGYYDESYQHVFKTLAHAIRWSGFDFRRAERGLFDFLKPVCARCLAEEPESIGAAFTAASSYFSRFAARVPSAEALALLCDLNAAIAERAGQCYRCRRAPLAILYFS